MLKPVVLAAATAVALGASPPIWAEGGETAATLSEVVITEAAHKADGPGRLRDEVVKTESISAKSIEKSNASNITEAVDKRPGVSVQVECSVCNVRNISLNNLPGRFTTLLIDGIPLYSSVSSAYGLDSVNVEGVERIDIARGAGASLIAPEALAGTVNIITKRPTKAVKQFQLERGSFGERRGDAYLAQPFDGGALSLSLDYRRHDAVDGVGTNISQYAGFERKMGGLGYFLDDVGGFKVKGRIDLVQEDRGGGALGRDYGAIKAATIGQPFNFSVGPNASPNPNGWVAPGGTFYPYNGGLAGLSQIIGTERQQGFLSAERRLGEGKLHLAVGMAHHYQDSFYGGDALYQADQNQYFLESSWQAPFVGGLLTLGADYRFEDLKSKGWSFTTNSASNGVDNYTYRAPAIFAQVYRPFLGNLLEMNASLRLDDHNVFGTITSPRLNFLYHHTDAWSSRLSLGRGYRAPTSFFEQDHGILADSRIVRNITKPETSDNLSYALNYASDRFSWVASANYNRILNMARLTPGQPDPLNPGQTVTLFDSSPDPVTLRGLDWSGTWQMTSHTAASLGLETFSYAFKPGSLNFARPEKRAYLSLDSDFGPWDLTAKLTWTGPQDLARFYDYAGTRRYNLDGTPKPNWSPSYSVLDLRAGYRFDRRYSAFIGVNNLGDYQQVQHDSYLWTDAQGNLDVTHIWGPNIGRQIYAGIKVEM